MDTEIGDVLEMFEQAETQLNYIESTLSLIEGNGDGHVGVVAGRLKLDARIIRKIMRQIKRAAVATPNHLVALKAAS